MIWLLIASPFLFWFGICGFVWCWYFIWGQKDDTSGDLGIAVAILPILPIVIPWTWIKGKWNK